MRWQCHVQGGHDQGGDQQPAEIVGQRNARDEGQSGVGMRPRPMPGVDHLRIQEHVPGGQRKRADGHDRAGPAGQCPGNDQRRPGHHHPRQRDHHRYTEQFRTQRSAVGVGAERKPGVHADRLGQQTAAAGDRYQQKRTLTAVHAGDVGDGGEEEQHHAGRRDLGARTVGQQRVEDLAGDRRRHEQPRRVDRAQRARRHGQRHLCHLRSRRSRHPGCAAGWWRTGVSAP